MPKLIIQLSVAVLTFVIGTLASALFYGASPAPEIAKKQAVEVKINESRASAAPVAKIEPLSTNCGCRQSETDIHPLPLADGRPLPLVANQSRAPISGGVLNGKALNLPAPQYPAIGKAARASGTVIVQVVINERGCVESAHAVSGHPLLQSAAVEAASEACFTPTRLLGQPVKVTGILTYNFVL